MCVCNYSGLGHRSSEFGGHPDLHLSTCSYEISLILPRVLSLCSCRRPLLSCCPAATGRTEKPITNYHLPFTSYRFYLATCKTVSAQSSTQETVHRWHLSFEKLMIQAASGIWCSSINQKICVYSSSSNQVSQVLTCSVQKKKKRKNQRPILLFRRQSAVIIWYDFWYPLVLPIPRWIDGLFAPRR